MKALTQRIEYDWEETSLKGAANLLKQRKYAVKKLEIDGDNQKLVLWVRYMMPIKDRMKKGANLGHGTRELIDLETGNSIFVYDDYQGKTGVWQSFFDYILDERRLSEEENS